MIRIPRCKTLIAVLGAFLFFASGAVLAAETEAAEDSSRVAEPYTPSRTAKVVDLVFARPLAFIFAVTGGALFVATSPLMYQTGNLEEARERFVEVPSALLRGPLGG